MKYNLFMDNHLRDESDSFDEIKALFYDTIKKFPWHMIDVVSEDGSITYMEHNIRQKYYLIEWPESQKFIGNKDCIQSEGMSYFVPCELWDDKEK